MNRIPELTLSRTDACLRRRYTARFANSAGVVLLATGTAKVWSSFGQAKLLALPDPILGLAFGKLMLLVGLAELAIALCCLLPRVEARLKIYLVAWMATNFLLYQVGLWCIGWHHPCGCMGSLAGVLGLTDSAADRVMKGLLAYLLAGSYLYLWLLTYWRAGRVASLPALHYCIGGAVACSGVAEVAAPRPTTKAC